MTADPGNLYDWFARAASRHGDLTALEADGASVTYRELAERARTLAARLVAACGGTAPRRVGVLAHRTPSSYAAYLAVLCAGATVVPLNPEFPVSRTRQMVAATGLDMVVAGSSPPEEDLGVSVLTTDGAEHPTASPCVAHHARGDAVPAPDDAAYLVFTSGSTGRPKGVPILHRNICAYLAQVVARQEAGPGSRMSQTFDLTFDGSVHDLFAAWATGATLVVPRRSQLLSPVRFITERRITHWFSVPSLVTFASRLGSLKPGCMPTLRRSTFGGEALTYRLAREWQLAAPGSRLEVLYGPSELTVSCTDYLLPRAVGEWPLTSNGTVPIGRRSPGMEYLVLDDHGDPAEEGELCVRGAQRFPGYLDPADNTGRFLTRAPGGSARPYAGQAPPGPEAWYRTGDRVATEEGLLVHRGRVDQQVKIRGHRIELGEIETLLRARPGVREAVVLAVHGRDGEPDLEAAVTGTDCAAEVLHTELSTRLPAYMLPRSIAVLDELPRNPHGKIDRAALTTTLQHSQH